MAVLIEAGLSVVYFQEKGPDRLAVLHYARRLAQTSRPATSLKAVGIWQSDERYGYSHIPSSTGIHKTADYDVTYSIGPHQERVIPGQGDGDGTVLFLGGSYTFGQGVADDAAYPAVLDRRYWSRWRVVNRAVLAWGTTHAMLVLEDTFASVSPPSAVIYGMIPHHITRNGDRRSWLQGLALYGFSSPHFTLVNGKPVYRGVVGVEDGVADGPAVREEELALTEALLGAMHTMCEEKNVPFLVILLPCMSASAGWPPRLIRFIDEQKIPSLDLSEMHLDRFAGDEHPNARDHARIAEQIARSGFVKQLD